jgi:hypothetical protein
MTRALRVGDKLSLPPGRRYPDGGAVGGTADGGGGEARRRR